MNYKIKQKMNRDKINLKNKNIEKKWNNLSYRVCV